MKIVTNRNQIKQFLMLILFTGIFFFGILVAYNSRNLSDRIDNKLLVVLLMAIMTWLMFYRKKSSIKILPYRIFILLCCLVIINSIFRFDLSGLVSGITALIIGMLLRRCLPNNFDNIYLALSGGMILACILTVMRFSVSSFNTQGIILTFGGVMLLNFMCLKRIENIFLFVLSSIIIIILLSITRSRTSIMSFLIVNIISYCYLYMRKISVKNIIILLLGIVILLSISSYLEFFFEKVFFQKWGNTDLTSNRLNIWKDILENKSLLGHGINHLNGGDAHNTFFQILGSDGILVSVCLILLLISIFKCAISVKNKIYYLNFFSAWISMSMFENLDIFSSRMVPISILFLFHLFFLIGERNNESIIKMERKKNYR